MRQIGTGFSDADLIAHSEFFKKHEKTCAPSYYVLPSNNKDVPDVYFEPVQVWEVKAADLSISPSYPAAIGIVCLLSSLLPSSLILTRFLTPQYRRLHLTHKVDPEKGISLRFPRFMRIRDDKTPESATDSEQVWRTRSQKQKTPETVLILILTISIVHHSHCHRVSRRSPRCTERSRSTPKRRSTTKTATITDSETLLRRKKKKKTLIPSRFRQTRSTEEEDRGRGEKRTKVR